MNTIPPYIPENVAPLYERLKPASDKILEAFMWQVEKQFDESSDGETKMIAAIRIAFEAGFFSGASFMEENPVLIHCEPPTAVRGNVVKTADGRKYVANKDHILPEGAQIVADTPHADGDFSYVCGSDYCRCMQ